MNDIGFEKLIGVIADLNKQERRIILAKMKTSTTCDIGGIDSDTDEGIVLDANDLIKSDTIEDLSANDMVLVFKVSDDKYAIKGRMGDV